MEAASSNTARSAEFVAARNRLEDERQRLSRLLADLDAEGLDRETEADNLGEIGAAGQHPADVASETFERELDLTLVMDFRNEIAETEAALRRLDAGVYGVCERCHGMIDPARLEAVPSTRFCKHDEDRYELGGPYVSETVGRLGVVDEAELFPTDDELVEGDDDRWNGPEEGALHVDDGDELAEERASSGLVDTDGVSDDLYDTEGEVATNPPRALDGESDLSDLMRRQLGLSGVDS